MLTFSAIPQELGLQTRPQLCRAHWRSPVSAAARLLQARDVGPPSTAALLNPVTHLNPLTRPVRKQLRAASQRHPRHVLGLATTATVSTTDADVH